MADLSCYICTFNCARTAVDVDYFAASLSQQLKTFAFPPSFLVLALQEIAPISHSFLGASLIAPYYSRLTAAVTNATSRQFGGHAEYRQVLVKNTGMTALMVFAPAETERRIKETETSCVGVGVWQMGNKGAVGARFALDLQDGRETAVTFVAAHLAPMEDAWRARNIDWQRICEGLVFEPDCPSSSTVRRTETGTTEDATAEESEPLLSTSPNGKRQVPSNFFHEHTIFTPPSQVFFAGDLNYRTSDLPPNPQDHHSWPQPEHNFLDERHFTKLFSHDQLTREKHNERTLHHLVEPNISFPPTYKYSNAAQKQAASLVQSLEDGDNRYWLWAKHRVPSWCDRILYTDEFASNISVLSYEALPLQPTSDHRPVGLSITLQLRPTTEMKNLQSPFPVRHDWRLARASARKCEIVVGLAAYLALTWEGWALLAGTVAGILGGFFLLRSQLGEV